MLPSGAFAACHRTGFPGATSLIRVLITAVAAAALALAAFTNRELLLAHAGPVFVAWLALLGVVALGARLRGRALARPAAFALAAFVVAAGLGILLSREPARASRHLGQLVLVWLPLLAAAHARELLRARRELLLLGASLCSCLLLLAAFGPSLMSRVVLPRYTLDVDHRPRPFVDGANEDGVYTAVAPSDVRAEDLNVICLGDSFTANPQLPVGERWTTLLEVLLREGLSRRVRAFNFGWVSSSPVLQARRLRDIGAKYRPALVIQAFDMTDFHDDLRALEKLEKLGPGGRGDVSIFRALSVLLGADEYAAFLRERLAWLEPPVETVPRERFFAVRQPLAESEPLLQPSWRAILETQRLAAQLGARYALFVLPRYQQYNPAEAPRDPERRSFPDEGEHLLEPFRFFAAKAASAPFPIHSLREDFARSGVFPTCLPDDPHWNAAGNRVAAEAIARHILADGLLAASTHMETQR
jgi:hypothetical protein